MKKYFLVFVSLSIQTIVLYCQNDVFMKVGKTNVTLPEFKYIYEKNNANKADYSQQSIEEYLDLFTKFKLKVEKARQMKLDTITSLQEELKGYRKQLAASYLIDKGVTETLMKELYDRMKYDVAFSHIFQPINDKTPNAERIAAKAKMEEAKLKLRSGMSFDEVARLYSADKSTALNGGDMGFYTAKLPNGFYDLESALYNGKVGTVSDIIETKVGYHIIKVNDKRNAVGIVEIAHILVPAEKRSLADSIVQMVSQGADWDNLAFKYSIDKTSFRNGGKLAPFGINTYERSFENAAFILGENQPISEPVLSKSGWHILKLIRKIPNDSYDIFVKKMKGQISKDQRFDAAKFKLIDDIKKAGMIQEDRSFINDFSAALGEDFFTYKWNPSPSYSDKIVFTIGGNRKYSINEFAQFCKSNSKIRLKYDKSKAVKEVVEELFNEFTNEKAIEFEESNLEIKYPDFKALVREYDEGILLFEATKINVWDKANLDTVGLKAFYMDRKGKYRYDERAALETIQIATKDMKLANKIYSFVKKKGSDAAIKKFNGKEKIVSLVKSEVEKGDKNIAGLEWKKGAFTPLSIEGTSPNTYTGRIISNIIPARDKTLDEAKGYIVADYQDYLEKQWVNQLEREFPVVIYKEVLQKLIK
jgi:peptidyl-prolyl cis-trans isomerase SurA